MANVNNPHGLRPLMRNLFGGPVNTEEYTKPAASGTIYRQDPVIAITGGTVGPDGQASQNIGPQATAGTGTYLGVSLNHGATGAITQHILVHSPDAVYEIQSDGAAGNGLVVANLGKNANVVVPVTTPLSPVNVSLFTLGEASIDVTGTLDLAIHRLLNTPNNAFGKYACVEVTLNRHGLGNARTGV